MRTQSQPALVLQRHAASGASPSGASRGLPAAPDRPNSAGMKRNSTATRCSLRSRRRFEPLFDVAYNLWWSWTARGKGIRSRASTRRLYERVSENPIALLRRASQERLDALANDAGYLAEWPDPGRLDAYLGRETWFDRTYAGTPLAGSTIAYFSMEFGMCTSPSPCTRAASASSRATT